MAASSQLGVIDLGLHLNAITTTCDLTCAQQAVIRIAVIHDRDGHAVAILVNGGIYHHDLGVGGSVTRHIGDGG
ncbi:hypothetical protein, partial [Aeromonas veronii]|uniref:hypothetical protein n=1 Tax=Aeromonas veronii TaxID=654 RepID=UPI001C5298CC